MSALQDPPELDDDHPLGDATVDAFRRDGHVVVRGLASAGELDRYGPAIERATRGGHPDAMSRGTTPGNGAFVQAQNLWTLDDDVRRFVFGRRFARVAARLLGSEGVRLYHDQALFKDGGSTRSPCHQDHFFFPIAGDTVTMWMALVDIPDEVGSMSFASGSHRFGSLGVSAFDDPTDAELRKAAADRGLPFTTHGAMRAGDATFHAGWTVHTAPANPTTTVRAVMTVIYVADGARIVEPQTAQQAEDLERWMPGQRPGDLVGSPINPLL